ncbi:MAG: hypothetical protein FJZ58_05930 [Chlamydiae bacterium]|nr:hypothetical protein [Chlamydiota bacterium]
MLPNSAPILTRHISVISTNSSQSLPTAWGSVDSSTQKQIEKEFSTYEKALQQYETSYQALKERHHKKIEHVAGLQQLLNKKTQELNTLNSYYTLILQEHRQLQSILTQQQEQSSLAQERLMSSLFQKSQEALYLKQQCKQLQTENTRLRYITNEQSQNIASLQQRVQQFKNARKQFVQMKALLVETRRQLQEAHTKPKSKWW